MKPMIAIVGDFDAGKKTHIATNLAVTNAGLRYEWVATSDLDDAPAQRVAPYDGVWIAPGSPYRSLTGALAAVRYARERGVPLFGT